jgi:hypothetical protein
MWRPHPNVEITQEEIKSVKSSAGEDLAKYGRFGVVDAKVREEEQRQLKIEKMDKWRAFRNAVSDHSGVEGRENKDYPRTFKIQLPLPEGGDVNTDVNE